MTYYLGGFRPFLLFPCLTMVSNISCNWKEKKAATLHLRENHLKGLQRSTRSHKFTWL